MTNDEKAKAYDDALERARKIHNEIINNEIIGFPSQIIEIFPELRESESEDERIRKELIDFLRSPFIKENLTDEKVAPWLDWLEKQKEPTTEELYAEAGTTENEYIANTMKMVRAMREKQKEQKPAEWSEEDEKMRNLAIEWAETMSGQFRFVDMDSTDFRKIVAWLKSLRPSWKPSEQDELMKLKYAGTSTKLD